MLLEEKVQGVSNRYFQETGKAAQYSIEIKKAVSLAKEGKQEKQEEAEKGESKGEKYGQRNPGQEIFPIELSKPLDYEKLFSYLEKPESKGEAGYEEKEAKAEGKKEEGGVMENEEAERMVQKFLVAAVLGSKENISYHEHEKFKNWLRENPALVRLYEQLSQVRTGDVDYGGI